VVAVGLLYVGAVLFVNGLWLLGKAETRETALLNLFTGTLTFLISVYIAFTRPFGDAASFLTAGQVLLFSFTYLWVGLNNLFNLGDGRALGWYCLFVAITTVPMSLITFQSGDGRFGVIWLIWGALWFVFFLTLALRRNLGSFTGYATAIVGIATCWIPGFLLLAGRW
jgi:hypothetical protein